MSDNGKEYTIQKGTYRIIDGELVQILDNELARECLMKELIAEGWTPPPKEPEPEFKPGEYVEVRWKGLHQDQSWHLARYAETYDTSNCECRHAPTWIKWEDGDSPVPSGTKGTVFSSTSRPYIKMYDGRWAWMPE